MNIVITGKNGYIANKLKEVFPLASLVSLKKRTDYSFLENQEVVIHTAALVHQRRNLTEQEYMRVNYELTIQLALHAKKNGVKQFIFFSTMAVFGNVKGEITQETQYEPTTPYGKSKLAAERKLLQLEDAQFKVAIIRPPMVYGCGCPGNYQRLRKISLLTPIFPDVHNQRSMLFIGNLQQFMKALVQKQERGIYHPQDPQLINTTNLALEIAKINNRKIYASKLVAKLLRWLIGNRPIYEKVFGDLYYSQKILDNRLIYPQENLQQALVFTEMKEKK